MDAVGKQHPVAPGVHLGDVQGPGRDLDAVGDGLAADWALVGPSVERARGLAGEQADAFARVHTELLVLLVEVLGPDDAVLEHLDVVLEPEEHRGVDSRDAKVRGAHGGRGPLEGHALHPDQDFPGAAVHENPLVAVEVGGDRDKGIKGTVSADHRPDEVKVHQPHAL